MAGSDRGGVENPSMGMGEGKVDLSLLVRSTRLTKKSHKALSAIKVGGEIASQKTQSCDKTAQQGRRGRGNDRTVTKKKELEEGREKRLDQTKKPGPNKYEQQKGKEPL